MKLALNRGLLPSVHKANRQKLPLEHKNNNSRARSSEMINPCAIVWRGGGHWLGALIFSQNLPAPPMMPLHLDSQSSLVSFQ